MITMVIHIAVSLVRSHDSLYLIYSVRVSECTQYSNSNRTNLFAGAILVQCLKQQTNGIINNIS